MKFEKLVVYKRTRLEVLKFYLEISDIGSTIVWIQTFFFVKLAAIAPNKRKDKTSVHNRKQVVQEKG